MVRFLIAALCALMVSFAGAATFAAPPPTGTAKSIEKVDEAVRLAEEGKAAFKAKKFMDAAEKFFAAYELSGKPTLLYNAARAYQEAGEYRLAIKLFDIYKKRAEADDDPKGVVEAERRVMECEKKEAERVAEEAAKAKKEEPAARNGYEEAHRPQPGPSSDEPPQEEVKVPEYLPKVIVHPDGRHESVIPPKMRTIRKRQFEPEELKSWKTWTGASAIAVGVGLLVGGGQMGASANERSIRSEADIAMYQSDFQTGKTLYYTGLGVIGVGVGLLTWATIDSFVVIQEEEEVRVVPTITPNGVGATLTARF